MDDNCCVRCVAARGANLLFVERFPGQDVGVDVEDALPGVTASVEDQTIGAMEGVIGDRLRDATFA